jgi:uncharacterized protein YdhG (YjbR/CyaY superfamily)
MKSAKNVATYIENAPEELRPKLREIRAAIREAAPDAIENISYGMSFYSFKGETGFKARLCYFGFLKKKIVFYTRPIFLQKYVDEVEPYMTAKSALRFSLDEPIPLQLIKKIVRNGLKEHESERKLA